MPIFFFGFCTNWRYRDFSFRDIGQKFFFQLFVVVIIFLSIRTMLLFVNVFSNMLSVSYEFFLGVVQ